MSESTQRHIEVHAHWEGLPMPVLMGILHVAPTRGKEIFSFVYDMDWLKNKQGNALDPALMLVHGR